MDTKILTRLTTKKNTGLKSCVHHPIKEWAILDSNQRPPQCQCDALPTALTAQFNNFIIL